MILNIKITLSIAFLLVLSTGYIFAQESGIPSEQVDVVKEFDAQLKQIERLKITPFLPPIDTSKRALTYFIPAKPINLEYAAPKIRPLAIKGEKPNPIYPGHVKFGYGTPSSPYAEFQYDNLFDEQIRFGASILHHSANYKDLEHQQFSDSQIGVRGTYYHENGYAIDGNIKYQNDQVYHYGYDHSIESFQDEAVRQAFKTLDVGASLFNNQENQGDINYEVGFDFYTMKDNFASKETGIVINMKATKWVADKDPIDLVIRGDFTTFNDTTTQKNSNFYISPSYTYHGGPLRLKGGINLVSEGDDFKFYPDVEATLNISGSQFLVFGGVTGTIKKNTYRSLSDYNPFISSKQLIRNTDYFGAFGGVKGTVRQITYEGKVGFKRARNLPLYLPDPTDTKVFTVLYDTASIVTISGTLGAQILPTFSINGTISQNLFTLENQERAWHLPATEINVRGDYTALEGKLHLGAELYVANGVPFLQGDGSSDNLNALLDLSLSGEYRISDGIGVFLLANNLTNNKRERWQRYPTFGLNVLGGITARF